MGVKGLKSYIENNRNILRNFPFRESGLIIDGCNLYYNLYSCSLLDQTYGGDYDAFENSIRQFFENLKACDIHPYVVLDGGADHTDKKFETLKIRSQDRIRRARDLSVGRRGTCFPILLKIVFIQTLQKLKVPFVQCLEEADWEIAALAKQWNCPVLSNDSDFYIFDLPAGLFPTECFLWRNVRVNTLNKKYIQTKHFMVERLCASFNYMNKDLLPVFACILGNDYVNMRNMAHLSWEVHSVCGGDFARIDGLLCWISKFPEPEAAIDAFLKLIPDNKDSVREALYQGIREYKLTNGSLAQFFHSKTPTACTGPLRVLPTWTARHIHEGKMGSTVVDVLLLKRVIINPQLEDFQRPSSSKTSRPIRQVIYGLLLLGEQQTADVLAAKASTGTDKCYVTEFDREGLDLISSEVEAIGTKVKGGLQLETLWKEPHTLRLQVFLDTLGVPSVPFRGIPLHLQLQVFVTRFWLVNAQPQPNLLHLWGLLLGMVHGRLGSMPGTQADTQLRLNCRGRISLDLEVAHLYSQWQSCLNWSLCLNCLLCLPLPEPECARLYCGMLVHRVVRELKRGITPESLLGRGSNAEQLFQQLNEAVLSLVDEDVKKRISSVHKAVGKTQSGNRSKTQSADELSSCFEHLMYEDIEDCDKIKRKAKDQKADTTECSYNVRTRHKSKARNASNPSKKFERRCFE